MANDSRMGSRDQQLGGMINLLFGFLKGIMQMILKNEEYYVQWFLLWNNQSHLQGWQELGWNFSLEPTGISDDFSPREETNEL